ncbi:MAG: hypothetical protein J5804_06570, partial [Eggerthellaceae bacterium]|nr:hypothetical protein [Eggerthellaceae bacterium]
MFGKNNKEEHPDLDNTMSEIGDAQPDFDEQGNDGQVDLSGLDVVIADEHPEEADDGADAIASDWDDEDFGVPDPQPEAPDFTWDDDDFDLFDAPQDAAVAPVAAAAVKPAGKSGGKHAAHAAKPVSKRDQKKADKIKRLEEMPDHQRRSIRTRRVLIVVLVLLLALAAAGVYLFSEFLKTSAEEMAQLPNTTDTNAVEAVNAGADGTDDSSRTVQKTQIPNLTGLFGLTQDEAIEAVGHGATVSATSEENEEGSDIKQRVSLELSEEPGDSKSGTPTVYLGLNEDGEVIMAGYSAATASLGYGTLSLQDIVANEHIIEHALVDAGLVVDDGTVALPEDSSEYQTYDSDGTTLVKESASFDG